MREAKPICRTPEVTEPILRSEEMKDQENHAITSTASVHRVVIWQMDDNEAIAAVEAGGKMRH